MVDAKGMELEKEKFKIMIKSDNEKQCAYNKRKKSLLKKVRVDRKREENLKRLKDLSRITHIS